MRTGDIDATIPGVRRGHDVADDGAAAPSARRALAAIVSWILIAIAAVAALAYWDAQREARAVFDDFAEDQAWVAETAARMLRERLLTLERYAEDAAQGMTEDADSRDLPSHLRLSTRAIAVADPNLVAFTVANEHGTNVQASISMTDFLAPIDAFERSDSRVLIHKSRNPALFTTKGTNARSSVVLFGLERGDRSLRLSRVEAAELGLPARAAIAGMAHVDVGRLGSWDVAAVASAYSERDRETRSKIRALLSVGVASALVIVFGGAALRTRTNALELRHALKIQELERERDERLVRADKLATMGALATGIAHEVSTPLGVILARAERIIARATNDDQVRRGGELIVAETERINAVVRGFLELARGANPRLAYAEPAVIAENATRLVAHRFAKADVTLRADYESDLPEISCDARLLEQVLVNLLLNACDACETNGLVELSMREEGGRVLFVVRDNGTGIDASTARRATEPFFTTKVEGTGLGLAIANEIVKHHRGVLRIRGRASEKGTEAIVDLPRGWEEGPADARV